MLASYHQNNETLTVVFSTNRTREKEGGAEVRKCDSCELNKTPPEPRTYQHDIFEQWRRARAPRASTRAVWLWQFNRWGATLPFLQKENLNRTKHQTSANSYRTSSAKHTREQNSVGTIDFCQNKVLSRECAVQQPERNSNENKSNNFHMSHVKHKANQANAQGTLN